MGRSERNVQQLPERLESDKNARGPRNRNGGVDKRIAAVWVLLSRKRLKRAIELTYANIVVTDSELVNRNYLETCPCALENSCES